MGLQRYGDRLDTAIVPVAACSSVAAGLGSASVGGVAGCSAAGGGS